MLKGRPLSPLSVAAQDRKQLICWSRRRTTHRLWPCGADRSVGCRRMEQYRRCQATLDHPTHGWQMEAALSGQRSRWPARRAAARHLAQAERRGCGACPHPDAGVQARRPNTLVTRSLAQRSGLSRCSIHRIWRAFCPGPRIAARPSSSRAIRCLSTRCATSSGCISTAGPRSGAVRRREESDSGAGPHGAVAAHATGPDRTPHARLQVTRHHQPLRRAGCKDRNDHRPNTPPSSLVRVSQIPRRHREERARGVGRSPDSGQLRHPQNGADSLLAGQRPRFHLHFTRPRPVGSIWSNDGLPC